MEINVQTLTDVATDGTVTVRGPKDFVERLDLAEIERTAVLFAGPFAPTAEQAIRLAVWQQWTSWCGLRTLLRGPRENLFHHGHVHLAE